MIDLSRLDKYGFQKETFALPDLERKNIDCGTLFLSEAAKKSPPRITYSDDAAQNTIICCCPLDAPVHIKGSGNLIVIIGNPKKTIKINLNFWGDRSVCAIGIDTTIGGLNAEFMDNDELIIGSDCMISKDVIIRPNDMHAIFDENDNRINMPAPIVIRDHVWIGQGVTILKGNEIQSGSIVGAGSMVTKDVPQASAVAGNPAKLVRSRIYWTRHKSPDYSERKAAKALIPPVPLTALRR